MTLVVSGPAAAAADTRERARWLAPASAFAMIAVGRALQIANGALDPAAITWIGVALVIVLAATVMPRPLHLARLDGQLLPIVGLAGLIAQIGQLYTATPGAFIAMRADDTQMFYWALAAIAVLGGSLVRGGPRLAMRVQMGALVLVHFAVGAWIIDRTPFPAIDVHYFQHDALEALFAGVNPYDITFRNIYRDDVFYGPGLSVDGRLQFGFPYFPLSLLMAVPGQFLGGDHRFSQLAAMELAALLMAFARPGRFGAIAAVLYLTTPRTFFVLEQSWTEPFVVLGLAAVVSAACRHSRAVPWLFGAFVALKQYLVFALVPALLLLRWPLDRGTVLRWFGIAAAVGAVVTLPFLLWNPGAFWWSVVTLQIHQPFRPEALSFLAWWASQGHPAPPTAIAFIGAAIASALALWRLPRTPAGFAAAVAVTFFTFFAFNKQAFCNYYFFVVGALAVTLAGSRPPRDER